MGFFFFSNILFDEDEFIASCIALPGVFCAIAFLKDRYGTKVLPKKLVRLCRKISDYTDDNFRLKFRSFLLSITKIAHI